MLFAKVIKVRSDTELRLVSQNCVPWSLLLTLYILHIVLYVSYQVIIRRICLTIKSFFSCEIVRADQIRGILHPNEEM